MSRERDPIQAGQVVITLNPVPPEQVVEGAPETGFVELGATPAYQWGVWEMTPGVMTDVEVDETFVVISGRGEVRRMLDGLPSSTVLEPGVVMTLRAGEETVWRVTTTLRKVYFSPAS